MTFPAAPDRYDRSIWQQILNILREALKGVFRAGQDLLLFQGERFSIRSSGGTEVDFTVDDLGNLITPTTGGVLYVKVNSAASLTLVAPGFYVHTGSGATWTLPAIAGHTGWLIRIKNRGSGDVTVQRAGSDQLYSSAAVNSVTVPVGATLWLCNDGTYWDVERFRAPYG